MSSMKQIEANRRNAQKSTGPRTEAGKLRSSRNAVKHGLCSEQAVIAGEDPADFDSLRDGFFDTWDPQDPVEESLVRQMITAEWRLRRLARLETAAIDDNLERELDRQQSCPADYRAKANSDEELADKLLSRIHGWDTLDRYARFNSANFRQFNQALKNLLALRKQRQQQPDQNLPGGDTRFDDTNPIPDNQQQNEEDTAYQAVPPPEDATPSLTVSSGAAVELRSKPVFPDAEPGFLRHPDA